jgi:hypothetical protein
VYERSASGGYRGAPSGPPSAAGPHVAATGADAAARLVGRLTHRHLQPRTRERDGAGEPVRDAITTAWLAGTDDAAAHRNVSTSRKTFRPLITTAITQAAELVRRLLTRPPITSRLLVKRTSGTSANGIPKESTT